MNFDPSLNLVKKTQLVTKYLYEKLQLVVLDSLAKFQKDIGIEFVDYYYQAESIRETCSIDPAHLSVEYLTTHFFIGNSIFHLSLELLKKFCKMGLYLLSSFLVL